MGAQLYLDATVYIYEGAFAVQIAPIDALGAGDLREKIRARLKLKLRVAQPKRAHVLQGQREGGRRRLCQRGSET
jgi:hypothetical protein